MEDLKNIQFKSQSNMKWLAFLLPLLPLLTLFTEPFHWKILLHFAVYTGLGINIFIKYNQVYAEIKDDKIYFFSGIGLYDPNSLEVSRITSVEKTAKTMLLIKYDEDGRLSIEAPRNVIDQMVKYFIQK